MDIDTDKLDISTLPEVIQEFAEHFGIDTALLIVGKYSGIRLTVPKIVRPDHPLVEVIGMDAYNRLCEYYGGEFFDIPKMDSVVRQIKHRRVIELRAGGCTVPEIALTLGYTQRRVHQILAKYSLHEFQLHLPL